MDHPALLSLLKVLPKTQVVDLALGWARTAITASPLPPGSPVADGLVGVEAWLACPCEEHRISAALSKPSGATLSEEVVVYAAGCAAARERGWRDEWGAGLFDDTLVARYASMATRVLTDLTGSADPLKDVWAAVWPDATPTERDLAVSLADRWTGTFAELRTAVTAVLT